MKTGISTFIALLLSVAVMSGCSNVKREDVGMVTGAVIGGAAVGAATDSAVGAVAGAVGGAIIGKKLSEE